MDNDNYLTLNEQALAEVSPTASQAIQNAFIDNYRQAQAEKTAQIGEAAHALGSDLEAQYGGLHGPSEYIKSRYQTPQTDQRLATLRTASQLSALNQLLSNDLANWADKAYQAKRNAVARSNTKTPSNTDPTGSSKLPIDTNSGNKTQQTDEWQPKIGDLVPSGKDANGATTYSYTDPISGQSYILQNPSVAYDTTTSQSSALGLWPDGSKMTPGSTYAQGGNTYTYIVGQDGRGKIYQRTYKFGA